MPKGKGKQPDQRGAGAEKTSRQRFMELAPGRTDRVLKALNTLGKCANRSTYDFRVDEVAKIFDAINKKVTTVKFRFEQAKPQEETFTL